MTISQEIIERVRQATGPDRELDARIWCCLNGKKFIGAFEGYANSGTKAEYTEPPKRTRLVTRDGEVIEASHSIDAALALAERVLPIDGPNMVYSFDLNWHASAHSHMSYVAEFYVAEGDPCEMTSYQAQAPTLPLAIVLATLIATQSSETK